MGFKLGSEKGNYAISGEIKSKMRFGKNSGGDGSVPGTPVISKKLGEGIMGEANNDGTIFLTDNNYIKWNGEIYDRKDGHIFFNEQWVPEGSKDFPWEKMPWE